MDNQTINERFRVLRLELGLSQTAFGEPIGLSRDEIKNIEYGKTEPKSLTIPIICREFNVDEHWLRTGEGEMFMQRTRSDEISAFMGDVLSGSPDFRARLIAVLAQLNSDEWALLEQMALKLAAEEQKEKADP